MSSTAQKIKEKLSIVDVVSSYVTLHRSGKNLKGKCPFHNEKTPSFFVSPDRESYHCFGCDKGGDIFSFVQEIEGLDFRGALKVLADKAGVELEAYNTQDEHHKERLYNAMEQAVIYYESLLREHKEAQEYLRKRGLTDESIKSFRIGFAKDAWRDLASVLTEKGFSIDELVDAGLLIKKDDGGYYDRFRGRIMFPLCDSSGRVIAFSGRIYNGDETHAKYINSPETKLYHKSHILYGLDKAKVAIRRKNACILVEGQMDVILSHQAGFSHTVASSGTALSPEQLQFLGRLTDTLIMAFDADPAGIAASGRGIDLALAHNFTVKMVHLPHGKDPADSIKENVKAWEDQIKGAVHVIDFYLRALHETTNDEHEYRKAVEKKVLPYVSYIKSKIDQAHYISRIADALGINEEPVWEEFRRLPKNKNSLHNYEEERGGTREQQNQESAEKTKDPEETRKEMIKKRLIGVVLWQKEITSPEIDLSALSASYERITGEDINKHVEQISEEEKGKAIFEAEMYFGESKNLQNEVDELFINLQEHILRHRLVKAMGELRQAEARTDAGRVSEILELCNSITKELNELATKKANRAY